MQPLRGATPTSRKRIRGGIEQLDRAPGKAEGTLYGWLLVLWHVSHCLTADFGGSEIRRAAAKHASAGGSRDPAGSQFGGGKERLRNRSIWRRAFFVGRPAPGPQTSPDGRISRDGAGALWSTMHSLAIEALTRISMTRTTSSTRSRPAKADTRSPHRTRLEGFAGAPLILTWPPLQAWVARDRVLYTRTAQSQRSIRISSTPGMVPHSGGVSRGQRSVVPASASANGLRTACERTVNSFPTFTRAS